MQVIQEEASLFNFVLFGATGDLAMRKILPALFSAHLDGKLHQDGRIICVAKQELNQESYLDWVHTQAGAHVSEGIANQNADKWQSFLRRVTYVALDATSAADYELLGESSNCANWQPSDNYLHLHQSGQCSRDRGRLECYRWNNLGRRQYGNTQN